MQYIIFENWDKFQVYKDGRRVTWIKLLVEIIEEFDCNGEPKKFFKLSDTAKLTFVAIACLRAKFKGKIPYPSDEWLRQRLGLERISIEPLESAGYIRIVKECTEPVQNRTREGDRDRDGDREREGVRDSSGFPLTEDIYEKYPCLKMIHEVPALRGISVEQFIKAKSMRSPQMKFHRATEQVCHRALLEARIPHPARYLDKEWYYWEKDHLKDIRIREKKFAELQKEIDVMAETINEVEDEEQLARMKESFGKQFGATALEAAEQKAGKDDNK